MPMVMRSADQSRLLVVFTKQTEVFLFWFEFLYLHVENGRSEGEQKQKERFYEVLK
jgi:hypothetical protein